MSLVIPRGVWDETPGPCWLSARNADNTPARPVIRCKCGELIGIGLHRVATDGTVTASFYHAESPSPGVQAGIPGCGFHEFIRLEGYDGPEFVPEARA